MSFNTLVKVAGSGALLVCGASSFAQWRIQSNLKEGVWYSESLRLLRSHRGATAVLGEPIIDGELNLASPKDNFCDRSLAQFRVPVQGPKDKGHLYLWASRSDQQWRVDRLELELASDASRRLLVHSRVDDAVDGEGGSVQDASGDATTELEYVPRDGETAAALRTGA